MVIGDNGTGHWVDSMPDAYDRWLVPTVFRPFARDMAARVAPHGPRRVLELAAGTGVLTSELVGLPDPPTVTATDLNEAMVDLGRRREPRAEWRQADAMDLPFEDASFVGIVCQFGVMFFPDRPAAFGEARRVLAPGGTLLFSTWGPLERHAYQRALVAAFEQVVGEEPTFMTSLVHGCANTDELVAELEASGLRCITVEEVELTGRADTAAGVAAGYCTGTPLRNQIAGRPDPEATAAAIAAVMEARLGPGPVDGPMTALVVEAVRL